MLGWAVVFLTVALVAGAFGFREAEDVTTRTAKVLFFAFLVLFGLALVF